MPSSVRARSSAAATPLLQVLHLARERRVARREPRILFRAALDLGAQTPYLAKTAVGQPEPRL